MRANDFAGLKRQFRALLASNEWYANKAGYEAHYASVFYSHFAAGGGGAAGRPARDRSELAVLYNGSVYLFEFKVGKPEGRALAQIRERGYADKYRRVPSHMIEFGERNNVGFEFETV